VGARRAQPLTTKGYLLLTVVLFVPLVGVGLFVEKLGNVYNLMGGLWSVAISYLLPGLLFIRVRSPPPSSAARSSVLLLIRLPPSCSFPGLSLSLSLSLCVSQSLGPSRTWSRRSLFPWLLVTFGAVTMVLCTTFTIIAIIDEGTAPAPAPDPTPSVPVASAWLG
jgi:hypothetical protein